MSIGRAPGSAHEPNAAPPKAMATVRRGLALSPELRFGLGFTVLLALIATAGRAIVPIAVQRTIDLIAGVEKAAIDLDTITTIALVAVGAVIVTGLASAWMNVRLASVTESALSDLRVTAFRHIHDLSMLHQATQQRGSLVSRVTSDIEAISRFLSWAGIQLLSAAAQVLVALVVMLVYSWQLTLVALVSLLPFVLLSGFFQRRLVVAYVQVREKISHMLAVLGEAVVGAPVVRAYGVEDHTRERLVEAIDDHRRAGFVAGGLSAAFSGTGEAFTGVATAAVLAVGVVLGINGSISPGTVIAFPFLIVLFLQPLQMAAEMLNEAQTAVAGWSRVLDILDVEADVFDPPDGVALPEGSLGVTFEGVGFRYPQNGEAGRNATGFEALRGVDVELAPLSNVAVVGETGSGKTTFAKLLTRLMDPTNGSVCVGGIPLDSIAFSSLRRRVVMVPQDDVLF
ncbi:MAG: ATP-binding cassette subfamily B protein, partial [Glaciecola sp.]